MSPKKKYFCCRCNQRICSWEEVKYITYPDNPIDKFLVCQKCFDCVNDIFKGVKDGR